jgi:hypothetical protein
MNDSPLLEARLGGLIGAYADRAPTDVDPMAMTRLAAAGPRYVGPLRLGFVPSVPGFGYVIIAVALSIALVGGALVVGGYPFEREPEDLLRVSEPVEPFIGLPPEGAPPSSPEIGELVLSFYARVSGIGNEVHGMWLYADGRLIWRRNLEGGNRSAFGDVEPTLAILEQRLTPEGVTLLLSDVARSTAGGTRDRWGTRGVRWGLLEVREANRMQMITWSDSGLPVRLADPGSWLPVSAWADRRIQGYVPSRHAVCPMSSFVFDRLPAAARDILLAGTTLTYGEPGVRCHVVETTAARAIAAILDGAGFPRTANDSYLGYQVPPGSGDRTTAIEFIGILPHGDVVGYGS